MTQISQRNATRNSSTADFSVATLFIFDNRFIAGSFKNNTGADITLKRGTLVARDTAVAGGFIPVVAGNLADVIGVSAVEEDVVLAAGASTPVNIGISGTVAGQNLVLPATITLNTTVGNKALIDVLQDVGFKVDTTTIENTKFDN